MIDWIPINSENDLPQDGRYLVTIQNKDGQRKVALLNWNQIWAGQKAVAYMPLPRPYTKIHVEGMFPGPERE